MNTYAYVGGNPLSRIDPLGLKAYTKCETQALLDEARKDMSANLLQRTRSAYNSHGAGGKFDFKVNQPKDSFFAGGRRLSAASFGNFIAGYSGHFYGGNAGVSIVKSAGVWYDAGDALWGDGKWDWDQDSVGDIENGAQQAREDEVGNAGNDCNCRGK